MSKPMQKKENKEAEESKDLKVHTDLHRSQLIPLKRISF